MLSAKIRYPLGIRLMRVRQRAIEQSSDDNGLRPGIPLKLHRSGWLRRLNRRG